jgi:tetratricopeptide (TPR) repeat protein
MMGPVLATINQQFMTGCNLGQQGMATEMAGNLPAAVQLYDQSLAWIQQSMVTAQQSGVFIPDNVLFAFSYTHFSAARAKNLLGWAPMAWAHLNQALGALNQAIAINPSAVQYHVAAGTIMMTMGNLPEAERAFKTALQLNPTEPYSQYMLGFINSACGNTTAANQYYAAVQQVAPNMPQMPAMPQPSIAPGMQGAPATGQKRTDWINTVNNVCSSLNNVFKTVGNFQDMMKQF